jgi:hypothetical protein
MSNAVASSAWWTLSRLSPRSPAREETHSEAVRLLSATTRRRAELTYRQGRAALRLVDDAALAALGAAADEVVWAEGAALPIQAAVAYASRARWGNGNDLRRAGRA